MNTSVIENGIGEIVIGTVDMLTLRDFRNYEVAEVTLDSGFNVIEGANAQGKTNILEALYLLATTRLLRSHKDSEAIREGAEKTVVTARLAGSGTELTVTLERGARKRALLNGLGLPRASDLIGRLPCVCVSTVDLEIVRGDPAERRLFLDLELSAMSGAYLHHLALYKRALEQRNALLRDSRDRFFPPESFEIWEDQLASHGSELRRLRQEFILELLPFARQAHQEMGSGEALEMAYRPKDEARDYTSLLANLAECRMHDIARGGTSVGPHRDDLEIYVGGKEARQFGSQGQQRTAVIAVKLATLTLRRNRYGQPPMLLLDDILSDLDEVRRARLVEMVLKESVQTVLTCTEASAAGEAILSRSKRFSVLAGRIKET